MRLDEDELERIDRWRAELGDFPSRAEAVRRLVDLGLAKGAHHEVSLSDGEKLLAIMVRDIYKQLDIKQAEIDPDFVADAIFGGHLWALKWEMEGLFHGHRDAQRDVLEVVDILDMWTFIEQGYQKLSKKDKQRVEKEAAPFGADVKFRGFDGNNEGAYMSIAMFLVAKMGRFVTFKGRELKSHMPSLDTYRRMLHAFKPMRSRLVGSGLNVEQIIAILQEEMHPERRK
jgi:uncharacterized protein YfbU (UPF0304 family)/Arc/MetJ-type ribon-helix-helix transcriptional regulator